MEKERAPCSICLISAICNRLCDKLETDTQAILINAMELNGCPDCGMEELHHDTRFNFFFCLECGHAFCGRVNWVSGRLPELSSDFLILDRPGLVLNYFSERYAIVPNQFEIRRAIIEEMEVSEYGIELKYKN